MARQPRWQTATACAMLFRAKRNKVEKVLPLFWGKYVDSVLPGQITSLIPNN